MLLTPKGTASNTLLAGVLAIAAACGILSGNIAWRIEILTNRFFLYAAAVAGLGILSLGALEGICPGLLPPESKCETGPVNYRAFVGGGQRSSVKDGEDEGVLPEEHKLLEYAREQEKKRGEDPAKAKRLAKIKAETMEKLLQSRQDERKAEIEKNMKAFWGNIICNDGTVYKGAGISSYDNESLTIAYPEGVKAIKFSDLPEAYRKLFDPNYAFSK